MIGPVVATGHVRAQQLVGSAVAGHPGPITIEVVEGYVGRVETNAGYKGQEAAHQQLLRDETAGTATGQGRDVEEARFALVPELQERFQRRAGQDLAGQPGPFEDAGRVVVEHARALPLLHI